MSQNTPTPTTRPLGVAHLIFGLVFTGIAAIWLIGEANDTDVPDLAIAFPAVLIGAGLIGLIATLVNHGRATRQLAENLGSTGPADEVTEVTEVTGTEQTGQTDETDETDQADETEQTSILPSTEKDQT